jgi:hypothetical protein
MQVNFYKYMYLDGSYQLIENGSVSFLKVSLPYYHQERVWERMNEKEIDWE